MAIPGVPGLRLVRSFDQAPYTMHVAWSAHGDYLAAGGQDGQLVVWDAESGRRRNLPGVLKHDTAMLAMAWHPRLPVLASEWRGNTIRAWDVAAGTVSEVGRENSELYCLAWSSDGHQLAVGDDSGSVGRWDVTEGARIRYATVHSGKVYRICWSSDGHRLVTASPEGITVCTANDLAPNDEWRSRESLKDIAVSPDEQLIAVAQADGVVRVVADDMAEIAVLEGHTHDVMSVRFSADGRFLASIAASETRIWRRRDWAIVAVLPMTEVQWLGGLDFHPARPLLAVKNQNAGRIDCYELDYAVLDGLDTGAGSRRYGNAKVVLLGDTGVGKSGLGLVLSGQPYRATDSTHGRNVWTLDTEEASTPDGGTQAREILLWDLAGQPGYRLVHQLHLNEVAVALIVFDSRSETDPFAGVKYWVRALSQARRLEGATAIPFRTYLVAARTDRGGAGVSAERIRSLLGELGIDGFFETSAKESWQISDLGQAVRDGIDWGALPVISSSTLFDDIKQFLTRQKELGRLLATVDELFRTYGGDEQTRASFETCIGLVEGRGLIKRLHFGGLVLLRPEALDAYASAMVLAARAEPDGLGFITETAALDGTFPMADTERVTDRGQEELLLIATVQELLRHEIALKEGPDLVFPSQFTRERPGAPEVPGTAVVFGFEGPLHHVYATLAVRLSHSLLFGREEMWQNASSFTATAGGRCGILLHELEEGRGELVVFYDERASRDVRGQFETYVHEHLRRRAIPETVTRSAVRSCQACGFVLSQELVRRRRELGKKTDHCPVCDTALASEVTTAPADAAVAEMNRNADKRRDRNTDALRLRGKVETSDYDVFLSYNSRDREQVTAIAERLKERGILPWLDVWEIPPGKRWQQELSKRIRLVRSAAVFVGARGTGPWQELEVEALLTKIAQRGCPIIPVVLDGRQGQPRFPAFLNLWQVVDMRIAHPDPFEQLVWGITGERNPGPFG